MAYIVGEYGEKPRRRRPILIVLACVAVVAVVASAFLLGTHDASTATSQDGGQGGVAEFISWQIVGTQPVPVSREHGPRTLVNGLASGFSDDELGAVIAVINIDARLSSALGPAVYEPTLRQQCVGDIDGALRSIPSIIRPSTPDSTFPTQYYYKLVGGSIAAGAVDLSIAAATPQATQLGGYAELTRTAYWYKGDWKLQVPTARPRVINSTDGYTPLGGRPRA